MTDIVPQSKFGWRERFGRAGKLFLLALPSVLLVELVGLAVASGNSGYPPGFRVGRMLEELARAPGEEELWIGYLVFGLPVALLHSLLSLAWAPEARVVRAHGLMTMTSCFAIGFFSFLDLFLAYWFAIFVLVIAHCTCLLLGPQPSKESVKGVSKA